MRKLWISMITRDASDLGFVEFAGGRARNMYLV